MAEGEDEVELHRAVRPVRTLDLLESEAVTMQEAILVERARVAVEGEVAAEEGIETERKVNVRQKQPMAVKTRLLDSHRLSPAEEASLGVA